MQKKIIMGFSPKTPFTVGIYAQHFALEKLFLSDINIFGCERWLDARRIVVDTTSNINLIDNIIIYLKVVLTS